MSPQTRATIKAKALSKLWLIGTAASVSFVATMTTYAQASLDPTGLANSVVTVAGKDSLLGVIWIEALVAIAAMFFAWQQFKVVQELTVALTKIATKLDRAKCMAGTVEEHQ